MRAHLPRLLPGRILLAVWALSTMPSGAVAEGRQTAGLTAPRIVLVVPGYQIPLPFRVNGGGTPNEDLILEIRGAPQSISFSHGENLGSGVWRIPASAVPEATFVATHLAEARVSLTLSLIEGPRAQQQALGLEQSRFVTIARRLLDEGQIVQARRFLERAAMTGSPDAALLMAATYDASELSKLKVRGLKPDPVEARRWQAHAQSLSRPTQIVLAQQEVSLLAAPKGLMPKQRELTIAIGAWKTEVHRPVPVHAPKVDTERLLQRGKMLIAEGRVAQSREYFRRAVEAGSAAAALSLAMTFDGAELAKLKSRGLRADDRQARHWYGRARELGAIVPADRSVIEATMTRKH